MTWPHRFLCHFWRIIPVRVTPGLGCVWLAFVSVILWVHSPSLRSVGTLPYPLRLSMYVNVDGDVMSGEVQSLTEAQWEEIEADTYWCLTKLLDGIQDHYTFAQPGIQKQIFLLRELIRRVDGTYLYFYVYLCVYWCVCDVYVVSLGHTCSPLRRRLCGCCELTPSFMVRPFVCVSVCAAPLCDHLDQESVQFVQFAFRWFNCLLIREFPLSLIIRMWDTYISEVRRYPSCWMAEWGCVDCSWRWEERYPLPLYSCIVRSRLTSSHLGLFCAPLGL